MIDAKCYLLLLFLIEPWLPTITGIQNQECISKHNKSCVLDKKKVHQRAQKDGAIHSELHSNNLIHRHAVMTSDRNDCPHSRVTDGLRQTDAFNWTVGDQNNNIPFIISTTTIPNTLDYRTSGYVSSVDNQGACNACWAFAVTGAVEALMAKKTGRMRKLSAQQMLDCVGPRHGCGGGTISVAMRYAKQFGLMTDCDYGYEAEKKNCRFSANDVVFSFKQYIGFPHLTEIELRYYIATIGPGITLIYIPPALRDYRGGIFSTRTLRPAFLPVHAILVVGYGSSVDKDYWIIKNSGGTHWGEQGYLRLERNVGLCGIGKFNYWPGS